MTCVDIVPATGNEMGACAFLCFRKFSVLVSTVVNTDRLKLRKQKLFGILSSFYGRKAVLKQQSPKNLFCKIVHRERELQRRTQERRAPVQDAAPAGAEGPRELGRSCAVSLEVAPRPGLRGGIVGTHVSRV